MITGLFICARVRRRRCRSCGGTADWLCDYPSPRRSGTCDAPICTACATNIGPGKDLCPDHRQAWLEAQRKAETQRAIPALACGCAGGGQDAFDPAG